MGRRRRPIKLLRNGPRGGGSRPFAATPTAHRRWFLESHEPRIAASDFLGALIAPPFLALLGSGSRADDPPLLAEVNLNDATNGPGIAPGPRKPPARRDIPTALEDAATNRTTGREQLRSSPSGLESANVSEPGMQPPGLLAELWAEWTGPVAQTAEAEATGTDIAGPPLIGVAAYDPYLAAAGGPGGGGVNQSAELSAAPDDERPGSIGLALPGARAAEEADSTENVVRQPTVQDRFGLSWGELAVHIARKRGELVETKGVVDEGAAFASLAKHFRENNVDKDDVHMYDEDDFAIATDEIVSAIQQRGVGQVAILGYSHGGGRTHDVAAEVWNDPLNRITNPFTIPFTAYIDAIGQPFINPLAEDDRPPGSLFHTNQYQDNDLPSGTDTDPPAPGDNLNRTNLGVIHTTIDDHPDVLGLVRTRLQQKVIR